MFLIPDATFFVQLINFAIFFVILELVFLRPVGKAIAERRAFIDGLTHEYDEAQVQAAALRSQAEEIRATARRNGEHALAKARAEASNKAASISAETGSKVAKIAEDAQRVVAGEVRATDASRPQLVAALADGIVDRVLAEPVA